MHKYVASLLVKWLPSIVAAKKKRNTHMSVPFFASIIIRFDKSTP
mgnify:CR=1 FL=1